MPMPRGRRPSMAASTRLGARNASEMVMLTCRALQFSRVQSSAMVASDLRRYHQATDDLARWQQPILLGAQSVGAGLRCRDKPRFLISNSLSS